MVSEIFNNENIKKVVVAWTEWTRQDFLVNNNWVTLKPNLKVSATCKPKYGVYDLHELQNWYNDAFGSSYPTPENIVCKNIHLFYSTQKQNKTETTRHARIVRTVIYAI